MKGLAGVNKDSVKVLFNASKVRVDFDQETISMDDIENVIESLGYSVKYSKVKA